MAQRGTVEVIDKGGWSRSFPLNKNILHIGSDARNDIVIETWHGAGLASRHLQLVPSPTSGLGYRLVNMGTTEVLIGPNGERSVLPRAALDLADGDVVRLGELMFVFRSEGAGGGTGLAEPPSDGTKEPAVPAAEKQVIPARPATPAAKPGDSQKPPADDIHFPSRTLTDDQVKQDYQLLRALDLLKGWELLRKTAKNK